MSLGAISAVCFICVNPINTPGHRPATDEPKQRPTTHYLSLPAIRLQATDHRRTPPVRDPPYTAVPHIFFQSYPFVYALTNPVRVNTYNPVYPYPVFGQKGRPIDLSWTGIT